MIDIDRYKKLKTETSETEEKIRKFGSTGRN